jgi:hypothetical protein
MVRGTDKDRGKAYTREPDMEQVERLQHQPLSRSRHLPQNPGDSLPSHDSPKSLHGPRQHAHTRAPSLRARRRARVGKV